MRDDVLTLLRSRTGHFRLESGHHGELWLDLERLCLDVRSVDRLATELGDRLASHRIDVICGPLVEGAFLALLVARHLDVPFTYSERIVDSAVGALYRAGYRIPAAIRSELTGRRVAIVNDVINAGSAVRATYSDVSACGGEVVAIGALAVLGSSAREFAQERRLALEVLVSMPNRLWEPAACPLCAANVALDDPATVAASAIPGEPQCAVSRDSIG